MNIWDSVHRGLEKASQEAARIARVQRLRTAIDHLMRDMQQQQGALLGKVMELHAVGQITQPEMLSLCQNIASIQQQLGQVQAELKAVQSQSSQPSAISQAVESGPPAADMPPGSDTGAYVLPPPSLPAHAPYDETIPIPAPPPPPGVQPHTISSLETVLVPNSPGEQRYCPACHAPAVAENVYCHNCGKPLVEENYPRTERANIAGPLQGSGEAPQQIRQDMGDS